MQYTYLRSQCLDRDEKDRRRTSLLTLICIRFHLPARTLVWARTLLGKPNRLQLVDRLLRQILRKNDRVDPKLLNWALAYTHPGVVRGIINSLSEVTPSSWSQEVMKHANPKLLLRCEYLTPDFQKIQMSRGTPKTVLVCFTGMSQKLNMPVQLFHCAVAEHFDLLLYLRDFSRQFFIHGVPGLGTDIDELATSLRTHIPSDCHLSILGTSGGGIAATRSAETLNANRLALFSPAYQFKDVTASSGKAPLDSNNALLYFSAYHSQDRKLVDEWRSTVLETSIRWLDTESHGTLSHLAKAGQFGGLIGWLLGGAPPDLHCGLMPHDGNTRYSDAVALQ